MTLTALALLLLAQGETPVHTFADVKKAAESKNFGALFETLAPSDHKELEKEWEGQKKILAGDAEALKEFSHRFGVTPEEVRKMSRKDVMLRMAPKDAERDPESFNREFRKYKEGEITEMKIDGDNCVLKVKLGSETAEVELAREGGKWYLSLAPEHRPSKEKSASARLKSLLSAQSQFRANDADGNLMLDFWVKDVAGLYGIETDGKAIKLIGLEIAQSDRTPEKAAYPSVKVGGEEPDYHFAALKRYREGGKSVDYDAGGGRNPFRFGFVAFPAKYPRTGKRTFILSEQARVFFKDTGGKPVEEYPEDLQKDGWSELE